MFDCLKKPKTSIFIMRSKYVHKYYYLRRYTILDVNLKNQSGRTSLTSSKIALDIHTLIIWIIIYY